MQIIRTVLEQARQHPEKTILYGDAGDGWTYRELLTHASTLAFPLKNVPGDRLGLYMKETKPFAASLLGTLIAGKVPVPLNYYLGSDALGSICQTSGVRAVVRDDSMSENDQIIPVDTRSYSELLAAYSGEAPGFSEFSVEQHARQISDPFTILLFTSGTTSEPKGVPLTEQNILSNLDGSRRAMDLRNDDHFLSSLPLFHSFGLTCGLLLPLLSGIPATVQATFAPRRVLATIPDRTVTIYLAVPSQYRALARRARNGPSDPAPFHERHDAIRFISGGEPLPDPVREQVTSLLKQPILEGYGLTETSPVVSVNRLSDHQPGSAGRPLDNVEVRTASTDDPESVLKPGERGEIQVNGPSVMSGYLNADRDPFTSDGWFRTGDVGKVDEDGYVWVSGRVKELIISSGENISPLHIEEFLLKQPNIEQAAVIGVADQKRGEVPVAFVTPKMDERVDPSELQSSIREHLGRLHVPANVCVREELPLGPTGKVLKRQLKNEYT